MGVYKQKGCVEDLELGVGTVNQTRNGVSLLLKKLNTSYLVTGKGENVDDKLDSIDIHVVDVSNPHSVNKAQIGLGNVNNTSDLDKPISNDTRVELDLKLGKHETAEDSYRLSGMTPMELPLSTPAMAYIDQQDALSFAKTDHVVGSIGSGDAGKPIVLNNAGRLDPTVAGSGLVFQGMFTPDSSQEYPPTDGNTLPGYYWGIIGLDPTTGYTFTGGDLAGVTIRNNDAMVYGQVMWGIFRVDLIPQEYYRLDGTVAISAPFAGGGFQLKNLANGVDPQDAATIFQINQFAGNFLSLDGTSTMAGTMDMGTNSINNLAPGVSGLEAVNLDQLESHTTSTFNPHQVTTAQIGAVSSLDAYTTVPPCTGIETLTQAEYDSLTTNPNTLYIIVG